MFVSNNRPSFHLWWKENLVKHQKVSKYYETDCSSRLFSGWKEISKTSIGKWNFWSKLLKLDMHQQNYQNLTKSAHRPPQILFTVVSLIIKKCLELVMLHKLAKISSPNYVYFLSYSLKCVSCFMLRYLMTSWHLNIWKVIIWISQEWKELLKWNKKKFFFFQKCSLVREGYTVKFSFKAFHEILI